MQDSPAPSRRSSAFTARAPAVLPIRFEDASVVASTTRILDRIDLDIAEGAPTVLMGPNGCGKTTLLKIVAGLAQPTSGRITFAGGSEAPHGSRSMVLQKPVMLRRTVADNIIFALRSAGRAVDRASVESLLELAHLAPLADRPARRLSGGEQQRLALARALARQPQLLVLDEPTASLDPSATKLVEEIVADIAATGVKILMATHDIGQARRLAGEIVFMTRGRIAERTPSAQFFASPVTAEARRFLAGDLVV